MLLCRQEMKGTVKGEVQRYLYQQRARKILAFGEQLILLSALL